MNAILSTSLPLRLCVIAAVALSLFAGARLFPRAAQTPASDTGEWEVSRTPYGHPDLQGNWTNATLTPFTRAADRAPVLTLEEVAEIESGQAQIVVERAAPSDPDRPPPPEGGTNPICIDSPTSCYNEVYREPGERVPSPRESPRRP